MLFLNILIALFFTIFYFKLTEIGNDPIGKIALISQLLYMIAGILLILIEKYPNILEGKEEANNLKISIFLFDILVPCLNSLMIWLLILSFFALLFSGKPFTLTYLIYLDMFI